MPEEHTHNWQWNGYYITAVQNQGVIMWLCACGKRKEEPVMLTSWWYQMAYSIWMYEQKHKGCFDKEQG